jgi:hypothetical protein
MLILVVFLIVLLGSTSSWRRRYHSQIRAEDLKIAPRISVQPAQSRSVRRFFEGSVTLLNVSSEDGAMLLVEQKEKAAQSSFLKSSHPIRFDSTLVTVARNGDLHIHAGTDKERELIVFKHTSQNPS